MANKKKKKISYGRFNKYNNKGQRADVCVAPAMEITRCWKADVSVRKVFPEFHCVCLLTLPQRQSKLQPVTHLYLFNGH